MRTYPEIRITEEMIKEAKELIKDVQVNRTRASEIDTIVAILGEFVFADWKDNNQIPCRSTDKI